MQTDQEIKAMMLKILPINLQSKYAETHDTLSATIGVFLVLIARDVEARLGQE